MPGRKIGGLSFYMKNGKPAFSYNYLGLDSSHIIAPEALKPGNDIGVWIEAQLNLRDEYEKAIYGLAEKGKLVWSSGTAPHLVEREQKGNAMLIKSWPLGLDASLTPTPAEPRNDVIPLKTYLGVIQQPTPDVEAEGAGNAPPETGEAGRTRSSTNHIGG